MNIKKTIRIQLFDNGGFVSDRMVTQGPEFYAGPKEVHNGPMRIEATLENKEDVTNFIDYLRKLVGSMPIKQAGERGRKESTTSNDDIFTADKALIVEEVTTKHASNQDDFIKELREMGFIFVTSDFLQFIAPEDYNIKKMHKEKYQWLIRRTKIAKDPKNDKYDPQIMFGIKISDERDDKVLCYLYGEFLNRYVIPVPEKKAMKLSKTNLIKFPHYMEEDERLKWGVEHRLLFNNPEKKPSKFYMRWAKDTTVGDELAISKDELQKRIEA